MLKKLSLDVDSQMPELFDNDSEMYAIAMVDDLLFIGEFFLAYVF